MVIFELYHSDSERIKDAVLGLCWEIAIQSETIFWKKEGSLERVFTSIDRLGKNIVSTENILTRIL